MKWSHGIAISITFFIVFILFLVSKTMKENIDLVAEDYYAQEIAYQEVIDGSENYRALGVNLELSQSEDEIYLKVPLGETTDEVKPEGKVLFFRPSDKKLDKEYQISTSELSFEKEQFTPGHYVVKCSWTHNGTDFYHERPIYVQ